jgi:predicted nucleotidyltransferase
MADKRAAPFLPPAAGDPVLAEAVRRLVAAYHPERIYLFGSVARGDAGPDSDYDLMVVVPDDAPAELRDCGLAYLALRGLGIAKDILVWTRGEFDKRLHLAASLPSTILREGKLLHAA